MGAPAFAPGRMGLQKPARFLGCATRDGPTSLVSRSPNTCNAPAQASLSSPLKPYSRESLPSPRHAQSCLRESPNTTMHNKARTQQCPSTTMHDTQGHGALQRTCSSTAYGGRGRMGTIASSPPPQGSMPVPFGSHETDHSAMARTHSYSEGSSVEVKGASGRNQQCLVIYINKAANSFEEHVSAAHPT